MVSVGDHRKWVRASAKLVFGALLFLVCASFLALPCLQGGADLFVSTAAFPSISTRVLGDRWSALESSAPASRRAQISMIAMSASASLAGPARPLTAVSTPLLASAQSTSTALVFSIPASVQTQRAPASALPAPKNHVSGAAPAAARSCSAAYKIFRPQADLFGAFDMPAAGSPFRAIAVLTVAFVGFMAEAAGPVSRPARAGPLWRRLRSLPFASADPIRLPYFAAQRDG